MNCAEGTGSLQGVQEYSAQGQLQRSWVFDEAEFSAVPPQSMGDLYFRFACQWVAALDEKTTSADLIRMLHAHEAHMNESPTEEVPSSRGL